MIAASGLRSARVGDDRTPHAARRPVLGPCTALRVRLPQFSEPGRCLYAAFMTVKAWLEGHPFDLDALVEMLPAGDTRVRREGDTHCLISTEIDDRPADVKFYEAAPAVLQRVNGLARSRDARYRPVRLSGRYQDGERGYTVTQIGRVESRSRALPLVALKNGEQAPPVLISTASDHLLLAASNSDVADALQIMGQPEPLNWVELYRVMEIIEHSGRLKQR